MILEEYRSNRNRQEARLDVKDNEARELSAIRIQRAKMNVGNEQVLFLAQVQELKDSQNDARTEKHLKLKNSLQEGKLDAAHQRSMEFVAQKSNSTMAMAGLQPLPPPPSFSNFLRDQRRANSASEHQSESALSQQQRQEPENTSTAHGARSDAGDIDDSGKEVKSNDDGDEVDEEMPPWMV